eukprot:5874956-Pleurochrysis_carterae.AAC.1
MHVENHVQMLLAEADFDLVLHHGLLDRGQADAQVGHQQRVGELDDRAAVCNYDDVALASGDNGWYALLSGLDHHVRLGDDSKWKPSAHVVELVLVTLRVHVEHHVPIALRKAWRGSRAQINTAACD